MESQKEILIMTPIGRVKWLRAPEDFDEILFHLAKTFNTNPMCLILKDANIPEEINVSNYQRLLKSEWDIILNLEIDNTLRDMYEVKSGFVGREERKIGRNEEFERNVRKEPEGYEKSEVRTREPVVRGNVRAARGKKGGEAKPISEEEKKIRDLMDQLKDCGFNDTAKCRAAIIKGNFDIDQIITLLL